MSAPNCSWRTLFCQPAISPSARMTNQSPMKNIAAGTAPSRGLARVCGVTSASKIFPAKNGVAAFAAASSKLNTPITASILRYGARYFLKIATPRRMLICCAVLAIDTKSHYSSNSRVAAGIAVVGLGSAGAPVNRSAIEVRPLKPHAQEPIGKGLAGGGAPEDGGADGLTSTDPLLETVSSVLPEPEDGLVDHAYSAGEDHRAKRDDHHLRRWPDDGHRQEETDE